MRLALLLAIVLLSGCLLTKGTATQTKHNTPEVWIEIHDVSPGWKYWRLEEIVNVTERHPKAYSKVVLFVIPNHANTTPLSKYPEFVKQLKELKDKGYILGVHGYAHPTTPKFEFDTTRAGAEELIQKARQEFEASGLEFPGYFAPPGWVISEEAQAAVEQGFDYVYYWNYTSTPDGDRPYQSREYTWYAGEMEGLLSQAKNDYSKTDGVFRLAVHLNAVNTGEGLNILDEFLEWIEDQGS